MTNSPKVSLNIALFGIVIVLASILVVTSVSQHVPGVIGAVVNNQITDLDLDLEEAAEAENATMAAATMMTNRTVWLNI
jgi:hypothetical protein